MECSRFSYYLLRTCLVTLIFTWGEAWGRWGQSGACWPASGGRCRPWRLRPSRPRGRPSWAEASCRGWHPPWRSSVETSCSSSWWRWCCLHHNRSGREAGTRTRGRPSRWAPGRGGTAAGRPRQRSPRSWKGSWWGNASSPGTGWACAWTASLASWPPAQDHIWGRDCSEEASGQTHLSPGITKKG